VAVIEEVPLGDDPDDAYYADQPLFRDSPLERFLCADCSYGVSRREPPERCPMCGGSTWNFELWRPFSSWDGFP
jgi:rubrerythrin